MPRKRAPNGNGTIYQRKDGRWEGKVTLPPDPVTGRTKRKPVYGKTQEEVAKKMRQLTAAVDAGTFTEPSKMTVGNWLDTWHGEYIGNVKYNTVVSYEQQIRLHLKPVLGSVKLTALHPAAIQKAYNDMRKSGLSAKSIRNVHGVFSKALNTACRLGYIKSNPASVCTLPRAERVEMKPLDKPELELFLKGIKGHKQMVLFAIAFFTGMREGELLGLQWSRVDFSRGVIVVDKQLQRPRRAGDAYYFAPPKNDKTRTITPAPFVMQLLKDQRRKQNEMRLAAGELWDVGSFPDLVFTNEIGRHLTYRYVLDNYKKVLRKVELEDRRFHDARHTYAVLSILAGDDVKTISTNLGHATVAFTLDQYAHYTDTMRQESASRMQALINTLNLE